VKKKLSFNELLEATKIENEKPISLNNDTKEKTEEEKFYEQPNPAMLKELIEEPKEKIKDKNKEILEEKIYAAKGNFVRFLSDLLDSKCVTWWFRIFFFFCLFIFMWFCCVCIYDFMYNKPPNPFFINIWKSSFEFIKLVFAIIGVMFVFVKLFLNGSIK
jgi:hypothetical protein